MTSPLVIFNEIGKYDKTSSVIDTRCVKEVNKLVNCSLLVFREICFTCLIYRSAIDDTDTRIHWTSSGVGSGRAWLKQKGQNCC